MILYINTSRTDLIQLKLISGNRVIDQLQSLEKFRHSELLLLMIDEILKKNKLRIQSLGCLAVVSGEGAFSALRLGVTTANAISWALKIPIVEINNIDSELNDKFLTELIVKKIEVLKKYSFKAIVPKYGREPNITKPKALNSKF
jgi:tRNA A37 threonylcarbamoyladenosine modification protein TsaB